MSKFHARAIFDAALRAADPAIAVRAYLRLHRGVLSAGARRYRLSDFDSVRVVGAGKATARMAQAVEDLLGDRISRGAINVPDGAALALRRIRVNQAGHPVPDARGVAGAREVAAIAEGCGPRDLVICLISGGASALMPLPAPGVTLAAKQRVTRRLLACGATIHEMNTVRKHLSAIKGGRLAALAHRAQIIALILSDVIGDNLEVVGSGPTVPDPTTCRDAAAILRRYGVAAPGLSETPKRAANAHNAIVGSNRVSMEAAVKKARELGYRPMVLSTTIDGETRDIARMHAAIAREAVAAGTRGLCFLSGGETTVTLRGKGMGGRNQEFVLAALDALQDTPGVTIFSAGTDGIDGPTDAAGAVAVSSRRLVVDPRPFLENNDSYHYFEQTGGLIKTGPTGTNVMDIRILMN